MSSKGLHARPYMRHRRAATRKACWERLKDYKGTSSTTLILDKLLTHRLQARHCVQQAQLQDAG